MKKDQRKLTFSSMSLDELHYVTAAFTRLFFLEWNDKAIGPVEIESRSLYEVSNVIRRDSQVQMRLHKNEMLFDIRDRFRKRIILTDIKDSSDPLNLHERAASKVRFAIKSKTFLGIISELGTLLDDIQLLLKKDASTIVFRGKKGGMTVELNPSTDESFIVQNDITLEFPIRVFQHFSSLLGKFEKLRLSFGPTMPLKVEGSNAKWKIAVIVSKIETSSA